jgi:hypothetical protein
VVILYVGLSHVFGKYGTIGVTKSRRMRWAGHLIHKRGKRNAYKLCVKKRVRKRLLERPRCTCEVDIEMNLKGIGWQGMDWIYLV